MTEMFDEDPSLPAVLATLYAASSTIDLEIFRFWKGRSGGLCIQALAERAQAGVQVHVIFDSPVSERINAHEEFTLLESGVEISCYPPLSRQDAPGKTERAACREILIVDGTNGLVSGTGNTDARSTCQSSRLGLFNPYYRVWGSVAAQLRADFTSHWLRVSALQPKPVKAKQRLRRNWLW